MTVRRGDKAAGPPAPRAARGDAEDSGRFAFDGLDRALHEKARLGILTALVAHHDGVKFGELRDQCALTDGNLSRHLDVLRDSGLVLESDRLFVGPNDFADTSEDDRYSDAYYTRMFAREEPRLRDRLEPGGRLILLVPAHRSLYGSIDRAIGHYRRYERIELERLLTEVGFEIEDLFHVNATSLPGWYLNGRILHRESVPGLQARLADRLVPLYRLERRLNLPFGLSAIAFARRPAA